MKVEWIVHKLCAQKMQMRLKEPTKDMFFSSVYEVLVLADKKHLTQIDAKLQIPASWT